MTVANGYGFCYIPIWLCVNIEANSFSTQASNSTATQALTVAATAVTAAYDTAAADTLLGTLYTSRKPQQHLLATGVSSCEEPGSAHEQTCKISREELPNPIKQRQDELRKKNFFVSLPLWWRLLISVDSCAEWGWPDTLGTIQGVGKWKCLHCDLSRDIMWNIARALGNPSGFPSVSGYISQYIPPLVTIETQYLSGVCYVYCSNPVAFPCFS